MKRVLVVDDEPAANALAAEYLRLSGFEVVQRQDAESGLEALRAGGFDLVILDRRMPGLDGVEACRALKADPKTSRIPVILASTSTQRALESEGSGADAFLGKPYSPKDLAALVKRLLGG